MLKRSTQVLVGALRRWPCRHADQSRQAALHTALVRDPRFGVVHNDDLNYFRDVVGAAGVITDPDTVAVHNQDWMRKYKGNASVVLKPRSSDQLSQLLAYCSIKRLAVVPQGGNTGLVGGSVPAFDEVVISTSAMNNIVEFDQVSGALVCQAGCVLQTLEEHVAQHGFTLPLDLGAKGSCQIGGNVSTNAGGLRLLRYGSLHGSVLGLEVVTADGTVLDLLRTLRKDNTGYDLKQLFIGAEGTLGIITSVAIQCAPRPSSVQLAFLACDSFGHVQQTLLLARRRLGEILSAVEFLDSESMAMVTAHLPDCRNPLEGSAAGSSAAGPFYMLIETHGSNEVHDGQKLEAFLEEASSSGAVQDGLLAQSGAQADAVWRVREGVTESLVRRGAVYKYDVSMPVAEMYQLVEDMRGRLAGFADVRVVGYGHVGDGNLHLNVSAPEYSEQLEGAIEPFVYEWVTARRGSISAEHGLGRMKAECVGYSKPSEAVHLMGGIKRMLDPHGILNPYKVLPSRVAAGVYGQA